MAAAVTACVGASPSDDELLRPPAGPARTPIDLLRELFTAESPTAQWVVFARLGLGLAGVLLGARLLVDAATTIARGIGLSEWAVGVTVVAGGTSLPELATSIVAAKRKHCGLVIGNLVGSDLFNVLAVLGIAGVVNGLEVAPAAQSGLVMMLGMLCLLLVFMRSGWRLSHAEGFALVVLALARWGYDLAA